MEELSWKTTVPDNQLFKKLKTQWNHIDTGLKTKLNKLVISEAKSEALQFAKNIINFNVMNRVHLLKSSQKFILTLTFNLTANHHKNC